MTAQRVGWLGGSFDPVHDGHLFIARQAAEQLGLDHVLLVPAAQPPHKLDKSLASGDDRLALLEAACADDERLRPCDVELQREGPSYSYDTACELARSLGPDVALHFIIGADTLADLASWYRVAELSRLVTFCAVTRDGSDLDPSHLEPLLGADGVQRIARHLVSVEPHPASSTAVRAALTRGERPDHVPDAVLALIASRGLYGAGGFWSIDTSGDSTS